MKGAYQARLLENMEGAQLLVCLKDGFQDPIVSSWHHWIDGDQGPSSALIDLWQQMRLLSDLHCHFWLERMSRWADHLAGELAV